MPDSIPETPDKVTEPRRENFADLCRRMSWGRGTQIVGDEGYGPTVIEITAVGDASILARHISHNGRPCTVAREGSWFLSERRNWTLFASPVMSGGGE